MLFNSIHYIFFLPVVIFIYYSLPHRFRWMLLLSASYYFYMCWKAEYVVLIMISTCVDYYCGLKMSSISIKKDRKKYLFLSLFVNLGMLFGFKYFNFFNNNVQELINSFNILYNVPYFNILLPVGISFYTFQTLSYTIDIYNNKTTVEKHLGIFAVYVSFFPQLVAGPIERPKNLIPQFRKPIKFESQNISDGLKLILWGFFKKMVIADTLSVYVNTVYNDPASYSGLPVIIATIFFAFQIYCDFSGYSDIAIGTSRMMGINLMQNFSTPYFSKSIREFWSRWHISLSTWFKDYLYIPLGGNRVTKSRLLLNLLLVFIISGLWHGANWTFIIWGTLHGIYMISGVLIKKLFHNKSFSAKVPTLSKLVHISTTYLLVNFAWVFFRANSVSDAFLILKNIFVFDNSFFQIHIIKNHSTIYTSILFIILMEVIHFLQRKGSIIQLINKQNTYIRWSLYFIFLWIILIFGEFGNKQFIYFQF